MNFDNEKKQCLAKIDKSIKQSVDDRMQNICSLINSMKNHYTTSSCSGRVLLIEKKSGSKQECKWLYLTHEYADFDSLNESLKKIDKYPIWFQCEPFILHVCCRDIDSANRMLMVFQSLGLKHSGVLSLSKRIIIEAIGSERIQALVAKDGKVLVSEDYIRAIIEEANKKQKINHKNIDKIEQEIKTL